MLAVLTLATASILGFYSVHELAPPRLHAVMDIAFCRRVWGDSALALGLFVLAIAVRWWGLPAQSRGMWGDEAQLMIEARKFIQGAYTSPFIIDHLSLPALYEYVMSFSLRWAGGMDVTVARAYSGVLGAISVPLLYATARELGYPRRAGFVASVALATTFWDVSFSRLVLPNIMAVSATSATILLTVMAVRRSNLALAALAGLSLAWAFNAHLSGMIISPLVAGWLALLIIGYSRWWKRRGFDSMWPHAPLLDINTTGARPRARRILIVSAILGITALVCALPLLRLYFAPGSALQGHAAERFILSPENRAYFATTHPDVGSDALGILWYQFKAAAGMFAVRGDPVAIFDDNSAPLLDPFSNVLLIIGVASALWNWRRPSAMLILLWLTIPIILGTMLTIGSLPGVDAPSITRSIPAAPAMCLLIALGLEAILAAAGTLVNRVAQGVGQLGWRTGIPALQLTGAVLAAAIIGTLGIGRYWEFANAPVTRTAFSNAARDWATFLAVRGAIQVTIVGPNGWPIEYNNLYDPTAAVCTGRWVSTWTVCPPARVIVFDNDDIDGARYGQATRLRVLTGQPGADGVVRFWYVEGRNLPDPARMLDGMR